MSDTDRLAMITALVGTREHPGPFFGDEDAARFWAPEMVRVFRRVVGVDLRTAVARPSMTNAIAGPQTAMPRGVSR